MGPPGEPTTPADTEGPTAMAMSSPASRAGRIAKTDAEWRAQLTPEQYYVTRAGETTDTHVALWAVRHGD